MKTPISIIIPTFNEAANLMELLPQLQWADEIIVVDSFSQDETAEIVQKFATRFFQRTYIGPADQKNWAIPQAKHPWVLLLDADERLSPELSQEIQTFMKNPSTKYAGYWIGRQSHFMGQKIQYSGWQGDAVIRLIQRDLCRYNNKQVHEEIESKGKIGKLKYKLDHYTYKGLLHYLAKIERYAIWSAQDHFHKTSTIGFFHLYLKPFFRFINHFIFRKGFLDGRVGFIISYIMALSVWMRYIHIQKMQKEQP